MKKIKIATIGGGSSYTPELMEGFIKRYEELPIKEIWLVDVEEGREKQEIVGAHPTPATKSFIGLLASRGQTCSDSSSTMCRKRVWYS